MGVLIKSPYNQGDVRRVSSFLGDKRLCAYLKTNKNVINYLGNLDERVHQANQILALHSAH